MGMGQYFTLFSAGAMKDEENTKEQLIAELAELRSSLANAEQREDDRRAAEAELRDSAAVFAQFMRFLPGPAFIKDENLHHIFINEQFESLFDVKLTELSGKSPEEIWPAEIARQLRKNDQSVLRDGVPLQFEEDILRKGELRKYLTSKFPILRPGKAPLLGGIAVDITDRHKMEEALKRSELLSRSIIENKPDCIKIIGLDGSLQYLNPAGLAMLEVDDIEMALGKSLESFVIAEYLDAFRNLVDKVLNGEEGALQFEIVGVKGTRRWLDTRAVPISDEQGNVKAMLGLTRDITERKLIEDFQLFLAQSGGNVQSGDFFRSLATFLSQKLATDFVCIDRLEEENLQATTLVFYFDGQFEDNITYALKDTPCGEVVDKTICCVPSGVCELFPEDQVLLDMNAESYAGTILWNHLGKPIGLIELIWRTPLANPELVKSLLRLVGVRAAGELERMLAEEALKYSEARYREIFEQIMDYILVLEPAENGPPRIIDASESAFGKHGYSRDEMIGKPITFLDPEEAKVPVRMDNLSRDGFAQFEVIYRRKDGSTFPAEVFGRMITIEGKTLLYTIERDITDRKQAETQLSMLSTAIEQSPATVVITDADGTIEYVNPKFSKLTGYTFEEALGQNPRILKSGVQPPEVYEQLWQTITAGNIWRGEFCNKKKNGDLYWESAVISPVKDANGVITQFLAVKEDITELKKAEDEKKSLEAQLRQAQKMETIGTLAGGIAHDFNNIIQPVSSCAELLRSRLPADSPMLKYVDLMGRSVDRGRDLVKQLLTFSRRQEQEKKHLRLQPIIKETLSMLRSVVPATVNIREQIDPGCGPVMADPVQIQQVVMNLCTNACDAMNKSGVLTVLLEEAALDEAAARRNLRLQHGRYARITVQDTGHGMDDETQKRIFDPFFTTKEVGKGTGLGLSVVHGIVLEHGGEIVVDSDPGRGTTFSVYLPCGGDAAVENPEHKESALTAGRGTILFVDDEEDITYIAREMLEDLGYSVTAMTRNIEALEEFRQNPAMYDLVISDYSMPGMTGVELAVEIMKMRPDIPIILITGNNEAISAKDRSEITVREVVSKPFRLREIGEAIQRALDFR